MTTRPRLTKPQRDLLQEMKDSSTGGLYIDRYRRYFRTARALVEKGYARQEFAGGTDNWFTPIPDSEPTP